MKVALIILVAAILATTMAADVALTNEYVPMMFTKVSARHPIGLPRCVSASVINNHHSCSHSVRNHQSPTGRLLKRSLCNTFGGCGTKRSIDSPRFSGYRIGDEASEEQRYDADAKMIGEILEDIMEHLKRDQNYQQGKYVMLMPRRTIKLDSIQQHQSSPIDDGGRSNLHNDAISGLQLESD